MGMRLAWRPFQATDQPSGIFKHQRVGCAACCRFLVGSLPALILHFAAVETHVQIVVEPAAKSMSASQLEYERSVARARTFELGAYRPR